MARLLELPRRAGQRIAAHRREAVTVFGFVLGLTVLFRILGLAPRMDWMLNTHAAAGLPAAAALAMTLAWLPLMVIDMRRCTRETALRRHVEADLEQRKRVDEADEALRTDIRNHVDSVLKAGGPRIVYQPIVEIGTHDVVGYEALSRFDDRGNPAEWFAAASAVDRGVDLELAAVQRALDGLAHLPADTYLSINVGPATLLDCRLHTILRQIPVNRVVVELTEHCAITDYEEFRVALRALRSSGLRLAVDDAGAGYASLRHIVDLEPDVIKVDRSLVCGIDTDLGRRSLFVALTTFAADLGASLVAEGVETPEEARRLASWGVRFAQGWHFGRPAALPSARVDLLAG